MNGITKRKLRFRSPKTTVAKIDNVIFVIENAVFGDRKRSFDRNQFVRGRRLPGLITSPG